MISGVGLASARTSGSRAIAATISGLRARAADRPTNTSAPTIASASVRAFVVLRDDARATAEELQRLCREAIAPYKVPERVDFLAALPKNPTGKILKKELRGLDAGER